MHAYSEVSPIKFSWTNFQVNMHRIAAYAAKKPAAVATPFSFKGR